MKIIEYLSEQIEEELDDAEHYARKAIEYKDDCPDAASVLMDLSREEVNHSNRLHDTAVMLIRKLKSEGKTPTPEMQGVYDYMHRKAIAKAEHVADIQRMLH